MSVNASFTYPYMGKLLVGNVLERSSGQMSWENLMNELKYSDSFPVTEEQKQTIPFPLLYQLLTTHYPVISRLDDKMILDEERRLKKFMLLLEHKTNSCLDILPSLKADHIMTTNYMYGLEKAFFANANFMNEKTRSRYRFCLKSNVKDDKTTREVNYRIHTGYLAKSEDRNTGLWHIHGECSVPRGIVLGHDRYGRIFERIIHACNKIEYKNMQGINLDRQFTAWPELFLFGDVYILGLTLGENEFDLL